MGLSKKWLWAVSYTNASLGLAHVSVRFRSVFVSLRISQPTVNCY